jgi:hypothetical protein
VNPHAYNLTIQRTNSVKTLIFAEISYRKRDFHDDYARIIARDAKSSLRRLLYEKKPLKKFF